MARALLTVQNLSPAGMWPTLTPANATGHMFDNTEPRPTFLLVRNAHTAPVTVTIPSTFTRDGLPLTSRVISVPVSYTHLTLPTKRIV